LGEWRQKLAVISEVMGRSRNRAADSSGNRDLRNDDGGVGSGLLSGWSNSGCPKELHHLKWGAAVLRGGKGRKG